MELGVDVAGRRSVIADGLQAKVLDLPLINLRGGESLDGAVVERGGALDAGDLIDWLAGYLSSEPLVPAEGADCGLVGAACALW